MFAIDPRHAAMPVAHVFAKTNIRDRDDFRTFLFNRAQSFLNNAVLGIRAARFFIFLVRNSKKQNGLKSGILRGARLIDDFVDRELKNARHAFDRAAFVDPVADKKRENKIVRGQIRLTNKIS